MSGFNNSGSVLGDSIQSGEIDNGAVTYAKIQDVSATDKVLGRSTAGAGVVEEIACTAAGRALIDDATAAAQRTTLGLSTGQAYTQTFATAARSHPAPVATSLTPFGVSADNTLVDVTTAAVADPAKVNANFDDVADEVNKLITDLDALKKLVNGLIDDLQTATIVA